MPTTNGAALRGQTNIFESSLGLNCADWIGPGNRNDFSQVPFRTSQIQTRKSQEAEIILRPLRFHPMLQIVWAWAYHGVQSIFMISF